MPYCVNCKSTKSSEGKTTGFYTARIADFRIHNASDYTETTTSYDNFHYHTHWLCADCDRELHQVLPARQKKRLWISLLITVIIGAPLLLAFLSGHAERPIWETWTPEFLEEDPGILAAQILCPGVVIFPLTFLFVFGLSIKGIQERLRAARQNMAAAEEEAKKTRESSGNSPGMRQYKYAILSEAQYKSLKPEVKKQNSLFP